MLAEYRGYEYRDGERVSVEDEEGKEGEKGEMEEGSVEGEKEEGGEAAAAGSEGGRTPVAEQESGLKRWSGGEAEAAYDARGGVVLRVAMGLPGSGKSDVRSSSGSEKSGYAPMHMRLRARYGMAGC